MSKKQQTEIPPIREGENGVRLYHWTQLQKGNVFMQTLDSRMLGNNAEYTRWKNVQIQDTSTGAPKERAAILYDRTYVIGKFQSLVSDPLMDLPDEVIVTLLKEARERTKQGLDPRDWEVPTDA